jgi:very-short-patch-repair endonuclease
MMKKNSDTSLEKQFQSFLDWLKISYEKHKYISCKEIDIFLKPNLCIFLDGEYWHRNKDDHDMRISRELISGGYYVIRIGEKTIRRLSNEELLQKLPKKIVMCLARARNNDTFDDVFAKAPQIPLFPMKPKTGKLQEMTHMDKITEFLEEYKTFKEKAQGHKLTNDEIQFLFAVYLKNLRENMRFQKGSETPSKTDTPSPVTDKQKNYIRQICEGKGIPFNELMFNDMSKMEASKWIDSELNNGGG